jgi:hypothetical protein
MSFVGGDVIWNFNTISDQSSILSSSCPVEMDGIFSKSIVLAAIFHLTR